MTECDLERLNRKIKFFLWEILNILIRYFVFGWSVAERWSLQTGTGVNFFQSHGHGHLDAEYAPVKALY